MPLLAPALGRFAVMTLACGLLLQEVVAGQESEEAADDGELDSGRGFIGNVAEAIHGALNKRPGRPGAPPATTSPPTSPPKPVATPAPTPAPGEESCGGCELDGGQECVTINFDEGEVCCGGDDIAPASLSGDADENPRDPGVHDDELFDSWEDALSNRDEEALQNAMHDDFLF